MELFFDIYHFISLFISGAILINISIVGATVGLFFNSKQFRHPRYIARVIIFAVLLLFVVNTIILETTNLFAKVLLVTLLIIYAFLSYSASQKPIFYSKKKLENYQQLLAKGYSSNDENIFDKKPFYLIDAVEIYKYNMLKADHLMELNKFVDAYEVYHSINEKTLLKEEIEELSLKKTYLFYEVGDLNKAEYYLSQIEGESKPYYLMLKGMLEENKMNFEAASEYWQRALNVISETENPELQAMIYNNYG